jgi:mycofactocin precursor
METKEIKEKAPEVKKELTPEPPPVILEEINVEELAVDGICGIY